jgi:hypothetical protein
MEVFYHKGIRKNWYFLCKQKILLNIFFYVIIQIW